jgi:hypothetical protein
VVRRIRMGQGGVTHGNDMSGRQVKENLKNKKKVSMPV